MGDPLRRVGCRGLAAAFAALLLAGCATSRLAYPATAQVDHVDDYFGVKVADPYRWLEDDNSPETKAWVGAQNALTFGWLERIAFRTQVRERIRAIANYAKYSAPFSKNGNVYFYKNDGLQNQSVLYVQKGFDGTPEVLLDPNTFSTDATVKLESFTLSRDGRHAVVAKTAIAGTDWRELQVLDLTTRRLLPEVLRWVKFSTPAWRGDGFYYSRLPQPAAGTELTSRTENPSVWYHRIGTPQSDDLPVFEDRAHPTRLFDVATTEDERFAVLSAIEPGRRGNSLFVRDERRGETAFRPLVAEIGDDRFEAIDSDGDALLVLTNHRAPNRRLLRVDATRAEAPPPAEWATVLAERAEPLASVSAAGGKLFATTLKDVVSQVQVFDRGGALQHTIALPGPGTASGFHGEAGDAQVFYGYTSQSQPPTLYRYDIASRRSALFRAPDIPGFDASRYESRQVFYTSRDGTRVPMFIVHRKGLVRDRRNPTILYGYGGFNTTLGPWFSAPRIAWLEQGGVFAVANLRGGGEYGEAWYQAGTKLNKQNVFDDFIAAAEHLIRERVTAPDRLAVQGGSNGGLLVGAVVNQRPELFKVALPQVGVMDMLRFQKFSVGAHWISDYGSSDDEAQFRYLLGYSPLHNIRSGVPYPATLITTADHDDRVVPAHSFKYAATLQAQAGGSAPLLIRIDTQSGHGSSNLNKALDEVADTYAFIWANMGIVPVFGR